MLHITSLLGIWSVRHYGKDWEDAGFPIFHYETFLFLPIGGCQISLDWHLNSPKICLQVALSVHISPHCTPLSIASSCQTISSSLTSRHKCAALLLVLLLLHSEVPPYSHPNLHTALTYLGKWSSSKFRKRDSPLPPVLHEIVSLLSPYSTLPYSLFNSGYGKVTCLQTYLH